MKGQNTWSEIQSQGTVWRAAVDRATDAAGGIAAAYRQARYTEALFIGCGSTHYLSLSAASLANELLGLRSRGLPSSEVYLFPGQALPRGGRPALVAVSRSGETSETILAVRAFRQRFGDHVLTVGNYPESTLARESDAAVIVPEGQEVSIAQTRSFASMLVAIQVLAGACAHDAAYARSLQALPEAAARVLAEQTGPMSELGGKPDYDTFIFLGSGPFYGLACEGMLKMKEMSLSHSEAFHYMEFRHGPKSIVNRKTLIVALLSDGAAEAELRVLHEMRDLGSSVLLIADSAPANSPADYLVELGSGLPEAARLPLCLLPMQVLAYSRSIARGRDPDKPTNLDAVVVL